MNEIKLFVVLLIASATGYVVTTNANNESETSTENIDPDKDCPPNDRNCNGIPDHLEAE